MTDTLVRPATPSRAGAPAPPVPRSLVVVAAAVLVVGVVVMFAGGWLTGISWDESYHLERLRNFFAHGWYLLDGDLDGDAPGSWEHQRYVYGPVASLLLHAWSVLWGAESWSTVSGSAYAYAVRHLGVSLIALVGIGSTAALVRLLLHRWAWGLVAAAALVAVPTWTGHAMFNVKDIPVATGYTLVTLGAALMAGTPARRRPAVLMMLGAVLAVGTRPGIWPAVGLAFFVCAVAGVVTRDRARLVWLVGAGLLAVLVVWLTAPHQFADPIAVLRESVSESSKFGGRAGPRWYLPVYLLVELPDPLLIAGAIGTGVALVRLRRADAAERTILLLVLAQTFVLAVLAVVGGANVYTGIRQFLFAAPGLAVLVTLALQWLVGRAAAWRRWVAAGVLAWPMAAVLPLFPYVYVHQSMLATALDPILVDRMNHPRLEVQTDYWRTSVRELAPRIPAGGEVECSPGYSHGIFDRRRDDCPTDPISPLAAYDDERTGGWDPSPTEFLAVRTGNDTIADNCTELADVTRRLYWRRVVLATVSRCETVPHDYPAEGLRFDGTGRGAGWLLDGWSLHHTEPGAVVRAGDTGELALTMPRDGTVTLHGNATGTAGATLSANGVDVPLEVDGDRWSATVPADIAASYGARRLFIDLTAGAADLHLLTLEASIS